MQTQIRKRAGWMAAGLTALLCACSPQGEGGAAPVALPSGADPGAAKAADPVPAAAAAQRPSPVYEEAKPGIAVGPVAGVVALVLEGSDRVTAGELRIGRSAEAMQITSCLEPPAEATGPAASATVDIGGVPFTHFTAGDAAMSHYVSAESYRAVHSGACYAIDLVVAGTRPDVYDPPRTPPFSQQEAASRLAEALKAVYWTQ